ncbi:MAG: XRE family transcriptional regulator [Acidimicrobiaceae bacterium]|nr:XRE family transcriptional regulator [Acidimicrobiaceae bacterium]
MAASRQLARRYRTRCATLHELRRARTLTQQDLAEALRVGQPAVAQMEQRTDVCVSSLRTYIEAVGARLKIIAEFPEGEF